MTRGMDIDYLLQREGEERALAEACDDAAVRAVHLELAERYADAAWSAEEALNTPVRPSGLWPRRELDETVRLATPNPLSS